MDSLLDRIREIVRAELHATQNEIMTTDEAAAFLGIEKSYLYQLTHNSVIPFSKPGGKKLYFAKTDLVKWALSNRHSTNAEMDSKAVTFLATKKLNK